MTLSSLHDSNLVGVHWTVDWLALDFKDDCGKAVRIELLGVQALRVDDLQEGNIVSEVQFFDNTNYSENEQDLIKWLEYLVAGKEFASCRFVEEANRKSVDEMFALLASGKAKCFCLTPAYGGVIVCVYHELRYIVH